MHYPKKIVKKNGSKLLPFFVYLCVDYAADVSSFASTGTAMSYVLADVA